MGELLGVVMVVAIADNIVLTSMLGLCPFMSLSKTLITALSVGVATTFVLTLSCALALLVYQALPTTLVAILPLLLITIVAAIVQLTEISMRIYAPKQHRVLGVFLPLIATNCAILGSILLVLRHSEDLSMGLSVGTAALHGLGHGVGFTVAVVCLASLRSRISEAALPKPMRGSPILMLSAGLMALVFSAFT